MNDTDTETAARYARGVAILLDRCEAHRTTHSADACARILLATYNAEKWPLSFTSFRLLAEDLRPAALDVIVGHLTTGREGHAFGDEERTGAVWRRLRPEDCAGYHPHEEGEVAQ